MRVLIAATLLALAACSPTPAPTTAPPLHICDDNGKPCRGDVPAAAPN